MPRFDKTVEIAIPPAVSNGAPSLAPRKSQPVTGFGALQNCTALIVVCILTETGAISGNTASLLILAILGVIAAPNLRAAGKSDAG